MAITIESSDDESSAHSTSILAGDQDERERCIDALDRDETIDDRDTEGSILHFDVLLQHLVVESELMHIVDTVGESSDQIGTIHAFSSDR